MKNFKNLKVKIEANCWKSASNCKNIKCFELNCINVKVTSAFNFTKHSFVLSIFTFDKQRRWSKARNYIYNKRVWRAWSICSRYLMKCMIFTAFSLTSQRLWITQHQVIWHLHAALTLHIFFNSEILRLCPYERNVKKRYSHELWIKDPLRSLGSLPSLPSLWW